MIKKLLLAFAAATLLFAGATGAEAQTRIKVGVLTCETEPGIGLVVVSSKRIACEFEGEDGSYETYTGTLRKIGLDVGFTAVTKIVWVVFAAADTPVRGKFLAGRYVGGSGEATIGLGLGANYLIGGSNRSFALQPLSVQGQAGLNVSLAFAGLTLR
jgi:hypothetical protein